MIEYASEIRGNAANFGVALTLEEKRKRNRDHARRARSADREGYNAKARAWRRTRRGLDRLYRIRWKEADPVRALLRSAKTGARNRGLDFSITRADIVIPPVCPVFGRPFVLVSGLGRGRRNLDAPSVDRVDNTRGYVPGNVRVISWRANNLKRDATLAEIENLAAYMRGDR